MDLSRFPTLSRILAADATPMKELSPNMGDLLTSLRDGYKTLSPENKKLFDSTLLELAEKLGVKIPYRDDRDMFLVMDADGKFVQSFPGFREAAKKAEEIGGKYWNRTHPGCPKELLDQFDLATNTRRRARLGSD